MSLNGKTRAKLMDAFSALPRRKGGVSEDEIKHHVRCFELLVGTALMGRSATRHVMRTATPHQAAKEIGKLLATLRAWRQSFSGLSLTSHQAIEAARSARGAKWSTKAISGMYWLVNDHYPEVERVLKQAQSDMQKARTSDRGGGRRRKDEPREIAQALAVPYSTITGRRPTVSKNPITNKAGGPFVRLVAGAFDALNINASAENAARQAGEWFKATYGEN